MKIENKPSFKINRQSKAPLYDLIEQNFRELILSGQLKSGETIPPEMELSERYEVSRLTVRHALDNLTRQGWLTRRHGVGTFVAKPVGTRITPSKLSFTEQMRSVGRVPSSRQIKIEVVNAGQEIAAALGLSEGEPVVEICRIRLADGEPVLLETAYLSQRRFPEITNESDFSDVSLYETLSSKYQATVVSMDQTIEPVLLDERQAGYLKARPGTPAILSEVTAYSADGQPLEYSWSVTRGDRCKFFFHFRRGE
jgi:GntR family transcriptional regulator